MLQRLGLAQALLVRPKLLILDEPTDGLDPRGRAEIRGLIMRLKGEGVTVFVNSHILQEVELVCDRIAILDRGVLRYCGDVKQTGDAVAGQRTEFPVELIVAGEETSLREVLEGETIVSDHRLPDGTRDLKLNVTDQGAVDALVDRLRGQSCSILSLKRTKASLEESFLAILAQNNQGPPSGPGD
jgi:ABC-2 type transport system ATP-binding protein